MFYPKIQFYLFLSCQIIKNKHLQPNGSKYRLYLTDATSEFHNVKQSKIFSSFLYKTVLF